MNIVLGIFFILHGLVHLLYSGQSARLFQLRPGMVWPDGSWVFAGFLENETVRVLAIIACALAGLGFLVGGIALSASQGWWQPIIIAVAVFSALVFIVFWDGHAKTMVNTGLVAIIINAAILITLLVFKWPRFEF